MTEQTANRMMLDIMAMVISAGPMRTSDLYGNRELEDRIQNYLEACIAGAISQTKCDAINIISKAALGSYR